MIRKHLFVQLATLGSALSFVGDFSSNAFNSLILTNGVYKKEAHPIPGYGVTKDPMVIQNTWAAPEADQISGGLTCCIETAISNMFAGKNTLVENTWRYANLLKENPAENEKLNTLLRNQGFELYKSILLKKDDPKLSKKAKTWGKGWKIFSRRKNYRCHVIAYRAGKGMHVVHMLDDYNWLTRNASDGHT